MSSRFLIFLSIIATFLTLSAIYIGSAFVSRFQWADTHSGIIWLALGALVVIQLLGPYLYRINPDRSNRLFIIHWVGYTSLGVFVSMLFYTAAADIMVSISEILFPFMDVLHFEQSVFLLVGAMVLASTTVGMVQAYAGPRLYEVDILLPNLGPDFENFKIVQVSDLHVGPTIGRSYAQKIVERVNGLNPDMVAFTGDFIDGSVSSLKSSVEPLANVRAKYGVYFVPGNHEYYWGIESWLEQFGQFGMQVLLNEHVVIRKEESEIVVAGVTDLSAGNVVPEHVSDPQKAIGGAPTGAVKILLAHQPASYKQAVKAGFDLQLSGHTHGGQFFPWNLVVGLVHKYWKGLNKHENMWIYVNRGTGYWGPPIRFAVPAEITVLKLRRPM